MMNPYLNAIYYPNAHRNLPAMLANSGLRQDGELIDEAFAILLRDDSKDNLEFSARFNFLEMLLMYGANPNVYGPSNEPQIVTACHKGDFAIAELLLKYACDVTAKSFDKRTALHEAAFRLNKPMCAALIEAGASTNAQDEEGFTPLLAALFALSTKFSLDEPDREELLHLLLVDYVSINRVSKMGHGALFFAAQSQHEGVVRLLLDEGADVMQVTHDGQTCLEVAVQNSAREVVELLLEHGLPADMLCSNKSTPLHQAIELHQKSLVEIFVGHLKSLDTVDGRGRTPIMHAIKSENLYAIRILIQNNCALDDKELFMMAMQSGYCIAGKMLLDAGCCFSLKNLRSLSTQALKKLCDDHSDVNDMCRESVLDLLNSSSSLRNLCRDAVRSNLNHEKPFQQQLLELKLPKSINDLLAIRELDILDLSFENLI